MGTGQRSNTRHLRDRRVPASAGSDVARGGRYCDVGRACSFFSYAAKVLKVLVRDLGDHFQLVLQPDHGELSGQIAAAWTSDLRLAPQVRAGLDCAAARHDDGWSVWERHPRLD